MSDDGGYVPADSVTIRDQFAVIGRRWGVILLLLLVGAAASGAYLHSKRTTYVSHAQVQVNPPTANQFASTSTPAANAVSMPTEQKIASSVNVADVAAASLNNGQTGPELLRNLSVTVPATTEVLDFGYTAPTPQLARAGSNAFEVAYLARRTATNVGQIRSFTDDLKAKEVPLTKSQASLGTKLVQSTDPQVKSSLSAQIGALSSQINAINAELTQLSEINPTAANVIEQATLPTTPAGPTHKIVLAAGLIIGLALGLLAAFVIDAVDDHLHGPNDLAALTGAPVLARVPVVRSFIPWRRHDLAAEGTSHPKVAEAYRLLANRLLVVGSQESIRSILVASPAQGEGRSSVAANLAATFVDLGFRVWLVSADLMPPQVHELFAPDEVSGLISVVPFVEVAPRRATNAISGLTAGLSESEVDASRGHLTLMASADRSARSGRLLNPLLLARQVQENQQRVDFTIIDAPALLDFADSVPLLPVVDGVLVVADAGTTRRSELVELADLLEGTRARVIGTVLNRDGSRVVLRRARRAGQRISGSKKGARGRPGAAQSVSVPPSTGGRNAAARRDGRAAPARWEPDVGQEAPFGVGSPADVGAAPPSSDD